MKEVVVDEAHLPAAAKHAAYCELEHLPGIPRFATDYGKYLFSREPPPAGSEFHVVHLPSTRVWVRITPANDNTIYLDDGSTRSWQCLDIVLRNDAAKVRPCSTTAASHAEQR